MATQRTSSVGVIAFDRLSQKEHIVRIVNLSVIGVGIESSEPIEPGLVCFKERVSGHKFGVVTWCRAGGDTYQAGINFTNLHHDK